MLLSSLIETNDLEQAITYDPLIVTADTLVTDAIALMSSSRGSCTLQELEVDSSYLLTDCRASCVLVVEESQIVGIFTERDVVRLSAEGRKIAGLAITDIISSNIITIKQGEVTDIFFALNLFQRHRVRHLPIVNDQGQIAGMLTYESLRRLVKTTDLLQLLIVSEVMSQRIITANPHDTVLEVTKVMARENVSSVIIVEERNSLTIPVGIMTEKDIVQFQALDLDIGKTPAQTVMSSPVFTLQSQATLWTALKVIQSRRISQVVITGKLGEVLGIVTQTTIFQALNPLDIYHVVENLKGEVSRLETEKLELLQARNAELEKELEKQIAELKTKAERERLLNGITSRIRKSLDLQATLNTITTEVREFLDCDRVIIYKQENDVDGSVIAEDVKPGWKSLVGRIVSDPCFTPDWIEKYRHSRIQVVDDLENYNITPFHKKLLDGLEIRAKILVPIVVGNKLWGLMLACENKNPRHWQPEETELLQQLSVHVAIAIQQADLYQELQLELQERKSAESALAISEELYRNTLSSISDALFVTDNQGNFTFINPSMERMFGYSVPEVEEIGNIHKLLGKILYDPQQLELSGEIINIEHNLYDKFQRKHTLLINIKKVRIGKGTLIYSCRNITERKEVEKALKNSEKRLKTIVETSTLGLITVNNQGDIVFLNQAAARMFGRKRKQLLGWPFALPYDYDSHRIEEIELLQPSGQQRTVNMQAKTISWDGENAFLMSMADITELKQTEELLRRSEGKYRLLVENLPLGLVVHGVDTKIINCNAKACEFLELTVEQMQGKEAVNLKLPFFREDETIMPAVKYPVNQVISTLQPLTNYVMGVNRPVSNTFIWLLVNAFPEFNKDGSLQQVVVTFVDITERQVALQERQQAEIALKNSEQRFRQIAENLPEVIWMTNLEGSEIIFVSPQYEKIWGRSCDHLYQEPYTWLTTIHEDDRPQVTKNFAEKLATGRFDQEYRIIKPDGTIRWIRDRSFTIANEDGKVYRIGGVAEDVTHSKEVEAELRQLNEELEARVEQRTKALQESQSMLQLVLDTIPQRVIWKDKQSIIRGCNQIFAEDVGKTPEQLIGLDPYDISANTEEIDFYLECDRRVMSTGIAEMHIQETLHKADGSVMWIETNKVPLQNLSGEIIGILVTYEDVTSRRKAEEALRYSEERFRIALNNSPIIVSHQDLDLRYTWIYNPGLNLQPEQVIGKFDADIFLTRDAEKLESWKRQVLTTGKTIKKEIDIATGKDFNCYVLTIDPLRDRLGNIEGVTCVSLDITDRKKAEIALKESQYLIARISEATPDVIYIYDLIEKRNVYNNGQITRLLGYSITKIGDMGSQLFINIIHPDDLVKISDHHRRFQTAKDGDMLEIEYRVRDYQGNWHWFLSHDTVFIRNSENQPIQIIGAALDITERKQMEAELRQKNAELGRATRLKDEFLANMSHELRTPLNAILGMSESLLEEVFGQTSEGQKKAIKTIERSGKHLLELINDILDLSKVEAGKLELQPAPVACSLICNSSLAFVKQQALKKNIQVSLEMPDNLPDLVLDERRIRQVLINLLSNAVKFTPHGGKVKLVVSKSIKPSANEKLNYSNFPLSRLQNQCICFSVIDNGMGVAPQDLDQLFQPFIQIDSSLNRQHNGTGLGLALVQRLVELHNGEINVTSELGKGSCFSIYIPYVPYIQEELQPENIPRVNNNETLSISQLKNASVLIIEDSVVAAEQLSKYLQELKFQPHIYTHGDGAFEEAILIDPVLIFLDIELPNLSGWEILKHLKTNPKTKDIPVIVVSVVDERSQALFLGATNYLVKPINREQLCQVISQLQPSYNITNSSTTSENHQVTNTPTTGITATEPPLILIAEDNQANITTISSYLGAKGYRIILAKDGQQAVDLTQEQHPDLILMDIQMPGMDGLEAMNQIRADNQFQHTPILAITALAMPGDEEKCLAAGANDYLSKPIKLKFLVDKIKKLLHQKIVDS